MFFKKYYEANLFKMRQYRSTSVLGIVSLPSWTKMWTTFEELLFVIKKNIHRVGKCISERIPGSIYCTWNTQKRNIILHVYSV